MCPDVLDLLKKCLLFFVFPRHEDWDGWWEVKTPNVLRDKLVLSYRSGN